MADWALKADQQAPLISGGKSKYYVNDLIVMNCTSANHDAQLHSLKWFINADEANESQLIHYGSEQRNSLVLGLKVLMEQQYFQLTELRLRCVAIYHRNMAGNDSLVSEFVLPTST